MRINTEGRDQIAGGTVYHADPDGFVDIPDAIAEKEGLKPTESEDDGGNQADKAELVARAAELGIESPSTLARWGVKRLQEAIAEKEKA